MNTSHLLMWCLAMVIAAFLTFLVVLGTYLTRGKKWTLPTAPRLPSKKILRWIVLAAVLCVVYRTRGSWLPVMKEMLAKKQAISSATIQEYTYSKIIVAPPGKWSDIVEIPKGYSFDTVVLVGDDSNPRFSIMKNESGPPIPTTLNDAKNIKLGEHVGEIQYESLENYPLKIKVVITKI